MNSALKTDKKPDQPIASPQKKRRIIKLLFPILVSFALITSANPVFAAGGFSQKVTMWGCTETDFVGGSQLSGSTASAFTQHNSVICTTNLRVGARASRGSVWTGWVYSQSGSVSATLSGGSGTAGGAHQICALDGLYRPFDCRERNT